MHPFLSLAAYAVPSLLSLSAPQPPPPPPLHPHAAHAAAPATHAAAHAAHAPAAPAPSSPRRWADWWLRLGMTMLMIGSCFVYVFALKQPGVVLLIFALQSFIYRELVQLAVKDSRERAMPAFRAFYYYWFFVFALYCYLRSFKRFLLSELRGVRVLDVLGHGGGGGGGGGSGGGGARGGGQFGGDGGGDEDGDSNEGDGGGGPGDPGALRPAWPTAPADASAPLPALAALLSRCVSSAASALDFAVSRHEPICYTLYVLGFIAFVVSLRQRRNFKYQFGQFAFCHIALLLVVGQSTYLAANVFNGLIWFFVPCGLVVCNDSMAYVCGFFFGRTPLIRLSPKKTVEGFVGGALCTVLFAFFSTRLYTTLGAFDIKFLMACPVELGVGWRAAHCDVDAQAGGLYRLLPASSFRLWRLLLPRALGDAFLCSEMQLHAVAFALFASVVAPFSGFFASGFKRAFKIKDFGAAIPGHGGFTDRMDCQLIMGSFSYVYCVYSMRLGPLRDAVAAAATAGAAAAAAAGVAQAAKSGMQQLVERLSQADLDELRSILLRKTARA
jgi:CDP-diglyceride synthetase